MGVGPDQDRTTGRTNDRVRDRTNDRTNDRASGRVRDGDDAAHAASDAPCDDPSGSWPAPVGLTGLPRLLLADRQCSRPGCADRAQATLTYHYGQSQVWLDDLASEREPHSYDICARHAARLSVPYGWHLDDRRGRRAPLIAV